MGALGLNVFLPLASADLDAAARGLTAEQLVPGARGALIAGSGGPAFFELFAASTEASDRTADPLDRYTRRVVERAVGEALEPLDVRRAVHFPFGTSPIIPFQRLGRAAGLGGPGPLGLQIHPIYGAWWAYRALVVINRELPSRQHPGDGCAGCDAPCVPACPGAAVARTGFVVAACHAHRLIAPPCRLSCDARIACVRGPEHRYTEAELAFHMAASMPRRPPST